MKMTSVLRMIAVAVLVIGGSRAVSARATIPIGALFHQTLETKAMLAHNGKASLLGGNGYSADLHEFSWNSAQEALKDGGQQNLRFASRHSNLRRILTKTREFAPVKQNVPYYAAAPTTDEHGIITSPGAGEHKFYARSGFALYPSGASIYYAEQSGHVEIVEAADGVVYIKDIISLNEQNTWVKGIKDGNTITVPVGQPIAYISSWDCTLSVYWSNKGENFQCQAIENIVFVIDGDVISLQGSSENLFIAVFWDDDNSFGGYGDWETVWTYDPSYDPSITELISLPAGVTAEDWYATGSYNSSAGSTPFAVKVKVAFEGNDVYVSGMFQNYPNSWIKGTLSGSTVTFSGLQFVGTYSGGYNIFAVGTDGNVLTDFTMTYDAEAGKLVSDNYLLANAADDRIYYLEWLYDLVISKEKGDASSIVVGANVDVLPYTNTFDTEEEQSAFGIYDANYDQSTWTPDNGTYRYNFNSTNDADDWLFSPAIKLEAGVNYRFAIDAWARSASFPERLEVKMGQKAMASAMTTTVIEPTDIDWTISQVLENVMFRVEETGYYHFGVHAISDADKYNIFVDNFLVKNINSSVPTTITDLSIESDGVTPAATITFTAPAIDTKGNPLSGNLKVTLLRDGAIINVFEDVALGTEIVYVDDNLTPGNHTYQAYAANEFGEGAKTEVTAFIAVLLQVPYTADFSQSSSFELFSVIDANEDGKTWGWSSSHGAYYGYSTTNNADDYLVTMPVALKAGKPYNFIINAAGHSTYPERFEVLMGKVATVEGLNKQVLGATDLSNSEFADYVQEFTVEEDGNYYFAIHAISDADMFNLMVHYLSIKEPIEYADGSDVTGLLVNPFFEDSEYGWTVEAAAGSGPNGRAGNVRPGGSSENLCYEAWNSPMFDVYQIVANAPVGVYEIEVQGFYRYLRGDAAWNAYQRQESQYVKKGGVPVYVYMNNNATPFVNIFDEPVEYGTLYTNSVADDTYTDPNNEYWYPNQMNSSAEAFSAGMYKQSAFGLVARSGDVLRLGVKGVSNQGNDSWVIWDNFKLTYRGFKPEVIKPALEVAMADVDDYLGLLMGRTEYFNLTNALAAAEEGMANNDGELMFQALNALYDAKDPARISKDLFLEREVATDTLRLAEKIRAVAGEKLSQATLNDAMALLDGICGNTLYENDEIDRLKQDVTYMMDRLDESIQYYQYLLEAIDYSYQACAGGGEDTRQGLSEEINALLQLTDDYAEVYESGSLTDDQIWDALDELYYRAFDLQERIDNYLDPTEWAILKTFYEKSSANGAWNTPWSFSRDIPWLSDVQGVYADDGHVVEVYLSYNNLTGMVPQELFSLPRLRIVELEDNHLTTLQATVPAQVTDLWLGYQSMDYVADVNLGKAFTEGVANVMPSIVRYNHSSQSFNAPLYLNCTNSADDWWADFEVDSDGLLTIADMSDPYTDPNQATLNARNYFDGSTFSLRLTFDEGDGNFDGLVDVLDLQTSINYIFGRNDNRPFNLTAADLWADKTINVQDVVKMVDLLMASASRRADGDDEAGALARRHTNGMSAATVDIIDGRLWIDTNTPVAAFDVTISADIETTFTLNEQLRQMGMTCRVERLPNCCRLIGYSLSGAAIPAGQTMLGITTAHDDADLHVLLADPEAQRINVVAGDGIITGIDANGNTFDNDAAAPTYDLGGRRVLQQRSVPGARRSSPVIRNGQKFIK